MSKSNKSTVFSISIDYLAFDQASNSSSTQLPTGGTLQISVDQPTPNTLTQTSKQINHTSKLSSTLKILGPDNFSRRTHNFFTGSVDRIYVSVFDTANRVIGSGTIALRPDMKTKIIIPICDMNQRLVCNVHGRWKYDDFESSQSTRLRIAASLIKVFSFLRSFGWLLYFILLAWFVSYPHLFKYQQHNSNTLTISSAKLILRPGMTLYQGDHIPFCSQKRASLLSTSCEQSYLHLSEVGTFGIYSGASPDDERSVPVWQRFAPQRSNEGGLEGKNSIRKFFSSIISRFKSKDKNMGEYRVLLNQEDEIVLFRGKETLWKSKIADIQSLKKELDH